MSYRSRASLILLLGAPIRVRRRGACDATRGASPLVRAARHSSALACLLWLCAGLVTAGSGGSAAAQAGGAPATSAAALPRMAFYYGDFERVTSPWELASAMDLLVVEPEHVRDPLALASRGAAPIAYLSVGEVSADAPERAQIPQAWIAGENAAWRSAIIDVANSAYQDHLLHRMMTLVDQGYAGVFLDTLDSYQRVARDDPHRELLRRQLAGLILRMAQVRPKAQIWLNRGFELLPEVASSVHGVAAESLFDRYLAAEDSYGSVPEQDRAWLLAQLQRARDTFHLPVVVIDYRPPTQRVQARATAERIRKLGFIPYVSDGGLLTAGVGEVEAIPRRVLLVSAAADKEGDPPAGYAALAPVLEYLGYAVDHLPSAGPLPTRPLTGTYQGVITYLSAAPQSADYPAFIERLVSNGVPLLIFGTPGLPLSSGAARALGLTPERLFRKDGGRVRVAQRDAMIGFEADPLVRRFGVQPVKVQSAVVEHLVLADEQQQKHTAIATTSFGGVALSHYQVTRGLNGEQAWVVDPFSFLTRSLRIPPLPRLDVTTENGLRVAIAVVRGDGAAARSQLAGFPQTARGIAKQLFDHSPLRHTVVLSRSDGKPLSAPDARATRWLGERGDGVAEAALGGLTRPTQQRMLLQLVEPMAYPLPSGQLRIPLPTASDLHYIGDSPQSYPYAQVQQTLAFTESPRRLKPIALDYNAFSAATPGGMATLKTVYATLEAQGVFPLLLPEYEARVRAFRALPLLRHADGTFELDASEVPVTVHVPSALGQVQDAGSRGVLTQRQDARGTFVTLRGEASRLRLGSAAAPAPHIVFATGRLRDVQQDAAAGGLRFAVTAEVPLRMAFGGVQPHAHCQLTVDGRRISGFADGRGLVELSLNRALCGQGWLSCVGDGGK